MNHETWEYLKHGRSCETCYWQDKMNISPIRSEFEVRCMGCVWHKDLPYWESKFEKEKENEA